MNNIITLSNEAKELINELFEKGHTLRDIKNAMGNGVFLECACISQDIAEEIHTLLSEPFFEELNRNALIFCADKLTDEQKKYCMEKQNET